MNINEYLTEQAINAAMAHGYTVMDIMESAGMGGMTLAHRLAMDGFRYNDGYIAGGEAEFLGIATEGGWTVAHQLALNGVYVKDTEVLKLADKNGWTVAHQLAAGGVYIDDPEILGLADASGWTVENVQNTVNGGFSTGVES